jgi:protein TonB
VAELAVPDNMFRDVVDPSIAVGARKRYSVPFSIAVHALAVLIALIVPVIAPDVLPMPPEMLAFLSAAPAPSLPPPPPRAGRRPSPANDINLAAAPVSAPPDIGPEVAGEPAHDMAAIPVDIVEGVLDSIVYNPTAPPAPAPPKAAVPIRVGGGIRPPTKIKDMAPKYPSIALAARAEGVVILEATIGLTGRVEDVRILRSIPLLDAAAVEAVRQWEYQPTTLNGVPVPVLITVTVNFTLH